MEVTNEELMQNLPRARHPSKQKLLLRSQAFRESPSPPPSPSLTTASSPPSHPLVVVSPTGSCGSSPGRSPCPTLVPSPLPPERPHQQTSGRRRACECSGQCPKCGGSGVRNTLSVQGRGRKLRHQGSSKESCEGSGSTPCLSRGSSAEHYTDATGTDLEKFIPEIINKNMKDRQTMLEIEENLVNLINDEMCDKFTFQQMTSYQRMLVHRCAAFFGLKHDVDATGKQVIVAKTPNARIPETPFKAYIRDDIMLPEEPRRSILKRDTNSMDDHNFKSPDRHGDMEDKRAKSLEERALLYEKAKNRIFQRSELNESGSVDDFGWSEVPWSSTDSDNSSRFRLQLPDKHHRYGNKLVKVRSEDIGETSRPCVAKSYSFGGYGGVSGLSREDSMVSTHSAGPRLLYKQDSATSSMSWRLSPSSSGYKSQSQMSESVTPSPTSTPHPGNENTNEDAQNKCNKILWAVTDIESVPKGSIIIDPQTGQPIKNQDGTLYHYDPSNPPELMAASKPASPQRTPTPIINKEVQHQSPKKLTKSKSTVTNSSTSPILQCSLPSSPSPSQQRSFIYMPSNVESSNTGQIPSYPLYGPSYASPSAVQDAGPVYQQQPFIVYTSNMYGTAVPPSFEGRAEPPQLTEMPGTYYLPESPGNLPSMSYQTTTGPLWSGPVYFPNQQAQAPSQPSRYPLQSPSQPGFSTSFIQQPTLPPPNAEVIPVYQPQHPQVQLLYTNSHTGALYPTPGQQPVVYTQNPVYPTSIYPTQFSQTVLNSSSCSSGPGSFSTPIADQAQQGFLQSMSQLSLCPTTGPPQPYKMPSPFDFRQKVFNAKNKASGNPKNFFGSSHSSTGTNSPAATVISAFCPQNMPLRTPPETPTAMFNHNPLSMQFRQMGNVKPCTPGTNRSSPQTPVSDSSYVDRSRMPLPPAGVYHSVPYVMQTDARLASGRSQPAAYRQPLHTKPQQQNASTSYSFDSSRSHNRSRKSKSSRHQSSLPSNGK